MPHLFTFICEIGGGTYCSQVHAPDPESAVRVWATKIRDEAWADNLSTPVADVVINDLDHLNLPPAALDGLSGVWCMTGSIDNDHLLVTIVKSAWAPTVADG